MTTRADYDRNVPWATAWAERQHPSEPTTNQTPATPRQQQVLDAISRLTSARGYPPTYRELMATVGLTSLSSVHRHLTNLRRQGRVTWQPFSPRTLQVAPGPRTTTRVPAIPAPLTAKRGAT